MSDSFGAGESQERRRSDIARDTSQTPSSAGGDLKLGASYLRGRGREEPKSWSGGTIRRRTGASTSAAIDTSRATAGKQLSELSKSGAEEITERAASCKPSAASSNVQLSGGPHRRPASSSGGSLSGGKIVSASGTTSNTQRLSSIEILNENKQRQLQLEQQESFKQHLEERQRLIQQQGREGAADLAYSAYQVEPSAADYARMAAAANAARQQANSAASDAGARRQTETGSGSVAVNPFDEDPPYLTARGGLASEQNEPTTVSGSKGFLSTLMGEATEQTSVAPAGFSTSKPASKQQQMLDESGEELDSSSGDASGSRLHESTRYCKVAHSASRSYDYDGSQRDQRPFYSKDLPTLLAECRGSRRLVILIVAVALLLDNMLLTAVVPIIPAYLYKLRVYREHHGDLSATIANKSSTGHFSPFDTNQDGRVDEDEIEGELERRVNESLQNAQDRFSGSFFHPRVLRPRDKFGNTIDDDNDRDDDNVRYDRQVARRGGDSGGSDDGENKDQEDDPGKGDEHPSNRRPNERKNRYPRADSSSRKSKFDMSDEYEANGDDDDDDNDNNDDAGGNQNPDEKSRRVSDKLNGKIDREKKVTPMKAAPQKQVNKSQSEATRNGAKESQGKSERERNQRNGSGNSGEDENDDDEDIAAAKKWNKLKSSLDETAQRFGNDTVVLADMCLAYVLSGRPFPARPSKGDKDETPDDGSTPSGWSVARDGDEGSDNDDPRQSDGRKERARGRNRDRTREKGPRRGVSDRNAKVDRLKPSKLAAAKSSKSVNEKPDASKGDTGVTKIGDDEVIINHQDIVDESFEVGVMFASKPIVQAIANPFVGAITNRVGFTLPMFLGFTIMFLSTLVFAFGETYATLFLARAIQGVGSACTSVAGMSMIADRFPDDAERGNAMAVALGGLALGVVLGPPFGGFMYEFFGKPSPFIVLAILALLDGLLQLLVLQPRVTKCQDEGASLMTLIKDPYILVAAGAITFANTGIGILEPALPLWMMDTMQAKNWEQGVAFLPAALSYLFSTNLFGNLGLRIGRWRSAMLGLLIIGFSLLLIPFASRVDHLILPNGAIGFAIGMVDSTMMPMLGYLVDIRHTSVYGSVYAIGDVAFCASFVFGPALSGTLVELIGFEGLIITTALICFAFAPLLVLLRDPPPRQMNEAQMQEQSTLRYVNYSHLDAPVKDAK